MGDPGGVTGSVSQGTDGSALCKHKMLQHVMWFRFRAAEGRRSVGVMLWLLHIDQAFSQQAGLRFNLETGL